MRFDIITIFPEFFSGILDNGVMKRAIATNLIGVHVHDLRSFTHDRHRTVDDRPFGGGEGMVLKPEPLADAVESLSIAPKADRDTTREAVVLLSAQGKRYTQSTAREFAHMERIVMICGRYEGVDERVSQTLADRELSIGDYVLSGGELAAAVILDSTMRLLPGVLGNEASSEFESFGRADTLMATSDERPSTLHARCGRPAGLPPLHPTRRVSRPRRFPKFLRAAITSRSASGVANRRSKKRCATAPTCWRTPNSPPKTRNISSASKAANQRQPQCRMLLPQLPTRRRFAWNDAASSLRLSQHPQ